MNPSTATSPVSVAKDDNKVVVPKAVEIDVTHIKQLHYIPGVETVPALFEQIAESQFKVGKFLQAHNSAIVLNENHFEELNPENYASSEIAKVAKIIFPEGLPADFSKLDPLQKEFLAKEGGAPTAYYLGYQSHILPEALPEIAGPNAAKMMPYFEKYGMRFEFQKALESDPELRKLYFDNREAATVATAEIATSRSEFQGREIIIVYGGANSFEDDFANRDRYKLSTLDFRPKTDSAAGPETGPADSGPD